MSTASGEEVELDPRASPRRGPRPFTERRVNSLRARRERLPWPADKPYRILSLDGGGIRGVYAASILADIEKDITRGALVSDYFDAIAGTSTGGIVAIGLGLRKPAAEIERLYVENGNRVFPEFWSRHPRLKLIRETSLGGRRLFDGVTDVDNIVGDDTEPNPFAAMLDDQSLRRLGSYALRGLGEPLEVIEAGGRGYAGRVKFPGLSGVARQSGVRHGCTN
jgi:hypothetical protein